MVFTMTSSQLGSLIIRLIRSWSESIVINRIRLLKVGIMEPKLQRDIPSQIIEIIPQTHDTAVFRFSVPENFDYYAGQFVMLRVDMKEINGFKIRDNKNPSQIRAFSIASTPTQKGYVETAVKADEDGFVSVYMNKVAKVGDAVKVSGPYGKFYFNESMGDEIVLLGAGSGITPLIGILRYVSAKNLPTKVLLVYSNKTPDDIVYKKDLEELSKIPNIKIVNTITRAKEEHKWEGETGRISEEIVKKNVSDITKPLYYICGSPEFSHTIESMLVKMGAPKERVHTEKW